MGFIFFFNWKFIILRIGERSNGFPGVREATRLDLSQCSIDLFVKLYSIEYLVMNIFNTIILLTSQALAMTPPVKLRDLKLHWFILQFCDFIRSIYSFTVDKNLKSKMIMSTAFMIIDYKFF